jgi:hypothetical protein
VPCIFGIDLGCCCRKVRFHPTEKPLIEAGRGECHSVITLCCAHNKRSAILADDSPLLTVG